MLKPDYCVEIVCDVSVCVCVVRLYTKCNRPLTLQITVSDSDIGKSNGSDKGSRGRTKIDFKHFVSSRIRL